jgi:hypothetical protein
MRQWRENSVTLSFVCVTLRNAEAVTRLSPAASRHEGHPCNRCNRFSLSEHKEQVPFSPINTNTDDSEWVFAKNNWTSDVNAYVQAWQTIAAKRHVTLWGRICGSSPVAGIMRKMLLRGPIVTSEPCVERRLVDSLYREINLDDYPAITPNAYRAYSKDVTSNDLNQEIRTMLTFDDDSMVVIDPKQDWTHNTKSKHMGGT